MRGHGGRQDVELGDDPLAIAASPA